MSLVCACEQGALSMGLTSCSVIPSRIRKMIFTTKLTPHRSVRYNNNLNNVFVAFSGDVTNTAPVGNAWYYEDLANPIPSAFSSSFEYFLYYKDTYKLQTPLLDDVSTERGDNATEEVGGKQFFVRAGSRSFTSTLVAKPAEFLRFVEQLRCFSELGVFLVDEAGVVWGVRRSWSFSSAEHIAPIPVVSQSVSSKLEFPTASTVQKIIFSFEVDSSFSDYDFVPIGSADVYIRNQYPSPLAYRPPTHIVGTARINNNNLEMRLYTEIHSSAGVITIPVNDPPIGSYLPTVFDLSNSVLATPAAWNFVGNGIYTISPAPAPSGMVIRYDSSVYNTTPPSGLYLDFYSLYIRV